MKHLRPIPQPSSQDTLHAVLHTWNLNDEQQKLLAVYTSRKMYACQIEENLSSHQGQLSFNGSRYTPIYQNCTRFLLRTQCNSQHRNGNVVSESAYFVSFRVYRDMYIALIQPQYQS